MTAQIIDLQRERALRHAERLSFAGFFLFSGAFIVWLSIIGFKMLERHRL